MAVDVTVASINLDHLYAKNYDDKSLDNDISLGNLGDWALDDDDLFSTLFSIGDDKYTGIFVDSPRSDSSSSDSYLTPISPDSAYLSPEESIVPSPSNMTDPNSDVVSSTSNDEQQSPSDNKFLLDIDIDLSSFNFPDEVFQMAEETSNMNFDAVTSSLPEDYNESMNGQNSKPVSSIPPVTSLATVSPSVCAPTTSSSCKTTSLVLTEEEQRLLLAEGVSLPTDTTLTKAEEKVLKKVRRKIKNKQSAQESRKKKKCYMDGLEIRVKSCTEENRNLQDKVKLLEKQNKSLLQQLKQLQAIVTNTHPNKTQTGTCLMVLVLAFSLVFFPLNKNVGSSDKTSAANYAPVNVRSRTLLQVSDDYIQTEEGLGTRSKYNSILNVSEVTVDTKFAPPAGDNTLSDINIQTAPSQGEAEDSTTETTIMKTERK